MRAHLRPCSVHVHVVCMHMDMGSVHASTHTTPPPSAAAAVGSRAVRGKARTTTTMVVDVHVNGCRSVLLYYCRVALLWLQRALAIMAVISWFLAPALNMRTAHSAACDHSSASLSRKGRTGTCALVCAGLRRARPTPVT